MCGPKAQIADQVGLGEHHGHSTAIEDEEGLRHWGPSLAHIDEERMPRALQERVVKGHYEHWKGKHGRVVAGPEGHILHKVSVVFNMIGHQAESFVDM